LFFYKDSIEHNVLISRRITVPSGHILLVGFGESGKQSFTELEAFLAVYSVFHITLVNNYEVAEFQADLVKVFKPSGAQKTKTVFDSYFRVSFYRSYSRYLFARR
jgi:hypothetical protein